MMTTDFSFRKSNRQRKMDRKRYHQPTPRKKEDYENRHDRKQRRFYPLTAGEEKVCMPLSKGKTHKEIASDLLIATNTVSKHTQNAMSRIGVTKETALSRWITEKENGLPVTVGKRA